MQSLKARSNKSVSILALSQTSSLQDMLSCTLLDFLSNTMIAAGVL